MGRKVGLIAASIVLAACSPQQNDTSQQHIEAAEASHVGNDVDTAAVGDGPFGLDLSTPVEKIQFEKESSSPEKGFFVLNSVPRPSADFSTYAVKAYPGVGICEIRTFSENISGDSLGVAARAAADRISGALATKYGPGEKVDGCGGGEVSCRSEFWAMSVMEGERAYGYEWSSLPKGSKVRGITTYVLASEHAEPYLRLDYSVNDVAECEAAAKRMDATNL